MGNEQVIPNKGLKGPIIRM